MAEVEPIVLAPDLWRDRQSDEGVVVNWFKAVGAPVRQGEVVAEVMIDKVTLEVQSPTDGTIGRVLVAQGGVVKAGTVLAEIVPSGPATRRAEVAATSQPGAAPSAAAPSFIPATPAARRLARELGVDLAEVARAFGLTERVTEEDLKRYQSRRAAEYEVVPLSPVRRVTAQRMRESLQHSAQLTIFREALATGLVETRAGRGEVPGLSYTALIAWATIKAIARQPLVNAHWVDGELRQYRPVHLGIAVALTDGLIVVVVRHAQELSLGALAAEISRLVEAARAGRLRPEEVSGSTLSISNLGMFGAEFFTPVLNPPEVAILGVGRLIDRPVLEEGRLVSRPFLPLSLTIDHQALDGAVAATFLTELSTLLNQADTFDG
jgi:pyruvate dehydrogenase E2 component (dihydrolipoamide acetyltransferase)